jgi:hypothetical protein
METRKTKDQIVRKLESMLESGEQQRDKFITKLQDNPAYAMSWSQSMFMVAAEIDFATEALAFFNTYKGEEDPVQIFLNYTQKTVFQKSRHVSNKSTSVSSNYMDDCHLECRAAFLDDIVWL